MKAIFLDRDGTLIEDVGYLSKPSNIKWLPGVLDTLRKLQKDYKLFVVSNQSGIARGYFTYIDLLSVEHSMISILREYGIKIKKWKYCPHHPDITGSCVCRKPGSGMIDDLVKKYKIDLDKSWLIGDSECDMLAAANSGVRFIKVGNKPITSVYEVNEFHKIIELIRTEGQIR